MPETVREHYAVLPHRGGECIACGACEKRCPFGVPVMENMRRAAEVFDRHQYNWKTKLARAQADILPLCIFYLLIQMETTKIETKLSPDREERRWRV